MDYKFKQMSMLIASLIVLMVVCVVFVSNWNSNPKTHTTQSVNSSTVEESDTSSLSETVIGSPNEYGKQIGYDLYAWMRDDDFFDKGNKVQAVEHRVTMEIIPAKTRRNELTLREEQ